MIKSIYFAGGCFWGTEHFFKQIEGVTFTETGYANGSTPDPTYRQVYTDTTGYAETVHVEYDNDVIDLEFLVRVFFKAIDPTSLNRQREDVDTRYRTGIYYTDAVIRYLSALDGTYVLVSTHDIELARSFRETLDTYHFSESMHDGKLVFNYRLTPGVEYTRNAISILKNCGYPDEIIRNAESNTLKVSVNIDSISL